MTLVSLFKTNRLFFFGFLLFFLACVFVLLSYSKSDGFYLLNTYHSDFLTTLFIWLTYLGDGIFCVAAGVLLVVFKKRFLGLMVLSSYAISGIIAQVLKSFITEARPAVLLRDSSYQYFIDNVTLHNLYSFPSGHASSAFALAAVFSFAAENKNYSVAFLSLAILVGYSRIYLAQHFIDDVLAGAVIGLVSAVASWIYFKKPFEHLSGRKKISRS